MSKKLVRATQAPPSLDTFFNHGLPTSYDVHAPESAVNAALDAARRAKTTASIRNRFLARAHPEEPLPPAARLLHAGRGGRGGDVRFRLILSMLWLARGSDSELSYPARAWASLLGLPDPAGRGARRVKDALRALEDAGLVRVRRSSGRDPYVELLDDAGDGEPYELPGHAMYRLRQDDPAQARRHHYLQIPAELWTRGWMSILNGPAVAVLLIVIHEQNLSGGRAKPVWVSPSMAEARYGLSEDTRSRGLLQLEQGDLITVQRKPVSPESFSYQRSRNLLTYHPEVLTGRPAALQSHATRVQLRARDDDFSDIVDDVDDAY